MASDVQRGTISDVSGYPSTYPSSFNPLVAKTFVDTELAW